MPKLIFKKMWANCLIFREKNSTSTEYNNTELSLARPPRHFLRRIILSAGRGASVNMQCQPELCLRRFHCSGDYMRNIPTKHLCVFTEDTKNIRLKTASGKALKQARYTPCRTGATLARLYFCKSLPEAGYSLALFYFLVVLNASPYGRVGTASPCSERVIRPQQRGCLKKEKLLKLL